MKFLSISAAMGAVALSVLQAVQADLSRIVRVDQNNQQFKDVQGRTRWFHGTNMISKWAPWYLSVDAFVPSWSIVDKDIQLLKDLNINNVRLGVHWAGVEPVRGQYNQTILDIHMNIIKKFQDNGIYTLVEMHQDVWAAQICGHGAPLWFMKKDWVEPAHRFPVPQKMYPFAVDGNGVPSEADCNSVDWATSYLNYGVGNAFGRLYNNYDGLGDAFAAYWKTLATNYKGIPGVFGYNLMNEPWVGDHMADPTLLIPGYGDRNNMEALWNKCNTAIRTVDSDTLIFFEGSTYDILSGFNNVPGGDGSKTVHSYHYYKPPQLISIETTIKNRIHDANRLKTMGMMTEFQFWDEGEASKAGILETLRYADIYMQNWQGWGYQHLWRGTGEINQDLARLYARSYVEATAGVTKTMYFQDETAKYWVSWVADTSVTAPSLIRIVPKYYYPDGIRVFFVPAGTGTYTMDGPQTVQLHYTEAAKNGQTIQASVQPFFPTDIVKNPTSGKCMDITKGAVTPGTPIVLWSCHSQYNQIWKFKNGKISMAFDPVKKWDTFCLDTNPREGTTFFNVVLNPCEEGKVSQNWSVTPTGNIKNEVTGFCVDINGSNYKDGTQILAYPCGAGGTKVNQVWTLPRGASGTW